MKKRKTLIGLVATVCVIVAIFTLFADAFSSGVKEYGSSRGSVYQVMFGNWQGYDAVPGMIVAWVLLLVAAAFVLIGSFLPSKIGGLALGIGAVASLAGSIMFFFAPGMFSAVTGRAEFLTEAPSIGVGIIVSAVFGILGALIALFAARSAMKE